MNRLIFLSNTKKCQLDDITCFNVIGKWNMSFQNMYTVSVVYVNCKLKHIASQLYFMKFQVKWGFNRTQLVIFFYKAYMIETITHFKSPYFFSSFESRWKTTIRLRNDYIPFAALSIVRIQNWQLSPYIWHVFELNHNPDLANSDNLNPFDVPLDITTTKVAKIYLNRIRTVGWSAKKKNFISPVSRMNHPHC